MTTVATRSPNMRRMVLQGWRSALVLDGIMEQRRYGHILVAAGFKDKRGDGHQMRDVGDWCAFAALGVMQTRGKLKGKFKTPRQKRLAPGRHWVNPPFWNGAAMIPATRRFIFP